MAWFAREGADDSELHGAASRGSFDEFMRVSRPSDATKTFSGTSLLCLAPPGRRCPAPGSLSKSWAVCARSTWSEPKLLERMLDLGADVNEVIPKFGAPLETLAEVFKFDDETLASFYDVLFARPELDLHQEGNFSKSVFASI